MLCIYECARMVVCNRHLFCERVAMQRRFLHSNKATDTFLLNTRSQCSGPTCGMCLLCDAHPAVTAVATLSHAQDQHHSHPLARTAAASLAAPPRQRHTTAATPCCTSSWYAVRAESSTIKTAASCTRAMPTTRQAESALRAAAASGGISPSASRHAMPVLPDGSWCRPSRAACDILTSDSLHSAQVSKKQPADAK